MNQGSCRFSPDSSPRRGWGLGTRLGRIQLVNSFVELQMIKHRFRTIINFMDFRKHFDNILASVQMMKHCFRIIINFMDFRKHFDNILGSVQNVVGKSLIIHHYWVVNTRRMRTTVTVLCLSVCYQSPGFFSRLQIIPTCLFFASFSRFPTNRIR